MATSWLPWDPVATSAVVLLGLCLGSFLNVVIYRLPRDQSLLRPGSRCPSCGRPIRAYHNIPVLGWLWLRGRCASCRAAIPPRYPIVELLGGGLTLLAAYGFPTTAGSVAALWMLLSLLAVFFIDLEHRIIPDEISLGGTVLGLVLSFWTIGFVSSLIAAAVGAAALFLIGWTYERTRGRAGLGMGDVKLAAMLGAFLGIPGLVLTVLLASLVGSALGIGLIALKKGTRTSALPFGSFLAPAAMVVMIWGPAIWDWYLGFVAQTPAP
jgi:leader peptidase (prepilin peptidase)/N-methyltransferase